MSGQVIARRVRGVGVPVPEGGAAGGGLQLGESYDIRHSLVLRHVHVDDPTRHLYMKHWLALYTSVVHYWCTTPHCMNIRADLAVGDVVRQEPDGVDVEVAGFHHPGGLG